jgi:hypothetical protein
MTEQYEIKTYPTGKLLLPEGWYSRAELMELIEWMNGANEQTKARFDAEWLSSDPVAWMDKRVTPEDQSVRLTAFKEVAEAWGFSIPLYTKVQE